MRVVDNIIKLIEENIVEGNLNNDKIIQEYIDKNINEISQEDYEKIIKTLLNKLDVGDYNNLIKFFSHEPKFSILTYKKILRIKYNSLWEQIKINNSRLYVDLLRNICDSLSKKTLNEVLEEYKLQIEEISRFKSKDELKNLLKEYKDNLSIMDKSLVSKKALRDFFNDFVVKSKEEYIKNNITLDLEKIQDDFICIHEDKEKYEMLKEEQFINLLFNSPYYTNELKRKIYSLFDIELENNELRILIHNYFDKNYVNNYKLLGIDLYMEGNVLAKLNRLEEIRKFNRLRDNNYNKVKDTFKGRYGILIDVLNDYKNINNYILSKNERALINEIYWTYIKSKAQFKISGDELILESNNPINEVELLTLKELEYMSNKYNSLENYIRKFCVSFSKSLGKIKEVKSTDLVFDDDNYILNSGNYKLDIKILFDLIKNTNYEKLDSYDEENLNKKSSILFDNGLLSSIYALKNEIDLSVLINYFDVFNINNINDIDYEVLIKLINVYSLADQFTLSILTPEVCEKIINNKQFLQSNTLDDIKIRLEKAVDLVIRGSLINTSAVPYNVDIDYKNVKIRRFNNDDPKLLTSGIDTNTCFKLSGNDNDFVFYTVLSKNGFALKILDNDNNLIGRVSAFRHSNVLFLNGIRIIEQKRQLTTETIELYKNIYDALVKYGEEIIKVTKDSELPIDFIVCNKAGILESPLFDMSEKIIAPHLVENPLDMYNDDWNNFINTYKDTNKNYLQQVSKGEKVPFVTDYGSYPALLITSRDNKFLERKWDIKYDDPKSIYERPRRKISIFNDSNKEEYKDLINSIEAKYYLKKSNYDIEKAKRRFKLPKIKNLIRGFIGEDWYMILNDDFSISSCIVNEEFSYEMSETLDNLIGNINNFMISERDSIKKDKK